MTTTILTRIKAILSSKWFRSSAALTISGLAVYLALNNIDISQVWTILKSVNLEFVFLALLSVGINNVAKTLRWKVLMGEAGEGISNFRYLSVFFVGQFLNTIIPGRVGDLGRAYVIGGMGPGRTFTLGTVAVEKVIDSICYALLFIFLLFLLPLPEWVSQTATFFVGLTTLISVGIILIAYRRAFMLQMIHRIARILPGGWGERIMPRIVSGLQSLDIILDQKAMIKLALWSVLIWGTAILNNQLIFWAFQLDLSWKASLLLLIALQVGISIPSVPGRIGIFEYTCILALSVFGIDQVVGLSYGILLHTLVLLPTTIIGLIAFWSLGLREEQQKFRDSVV